MPSCTVCHDLEFNPKRRSSDYYRRFSDIQNASHHGCKSCQLILDSCTSVATTSFRPDEKIRLGFHRDDPPSKEGEFRIYGSMGIIHVHSDTSEEDRPWSTIGSQPATKFCANLSDYVHYIRGHREACINTHKLCSSVSASRTSYMPTRLLHVGSSEHDLFLVETGDHREAGGNYCNYVALSHCWGYHQLLRTTKDTLSIHKSGLIWAQLSRTFQDAVIVTRALGVDFIWIDSLCIVQDDADDWAREASKMASIYRNSYVTIAATSAADGQKGFLSGRRQPIYRLPVEKGGKTHNFYAREIFDHSPFWRPAGCNESRPLPLLTRGWCLQEQILSPHTVHFTNEELVWECHEGVMCECSGNNSKPGVSIKAHVGAALVGASPDALSASWTTILRQYCERRLTYAKDRLPALSGIAREFESHEVMGKYLAGHWERDIPFSLLWVCKSMNGRRENKASISLSVANPSNPSWSCASLEAVEALQISWQRWRPELKSEVQILEASCDPNTSDPLGQVSAGHMTFRGQIFEVQLAGSDGDSDDSLSSRIHPFQCSCQADTKIIETPGTDEIFLFLALASDLDSESGERSFSGIFLLASERPVCSNTQKLKTRTGCDYVAVRIGAGALWSVADDSISTTRVITVI